MKLHAFVAMPFGRKPGPDGQTVIDFDVVYNSFLKPALLAADCTVLRADEEPAPGDIRENMFQELLVADLVVADLTVSNANVWYELGVRHALRRRGVVLVYGVLPGNRAAMPFDVYTDRKLRYELDANGMIDEAKLPTSLKALTRMARESLAANTRRTVSPVYSLLPHLTEPQWRDLVLTNNSDLKEVFDRWNNLLQTARRENLPGNIMTLADEAPTRALAVETKRAAGNSLLSLKQPELALEQFEAALEIAPTDLAANQKRIVCLGRVGRHAQAKTEAEAMIRDRPKDPEAWALLGRVEKDEWTSRWREASQVNLGDVLPEATRAAATRELATLQAAVGYYRKGFEIDPSNHYAGINAHTLMALANHLGGKTPLIDAPLAALRGGLAWSLQSATLSGSDNYWQRATNAEFKLVDGTAKEIETSWREAIVRADDDWFALDSSRQTLVLLRQLGFRAEETQAALNVLDQEMARVAPPWSPRQVLLFSGHMMDAPTREKPRFPASMEAAVITRIDAELDALNAGPEDLALCQSAAGGDLIFLEACARRGVRCQVQLPFEEPEFIKQSMLASTNGQNWRKRWLALKTNNSIKPRIMTDHLGETDPDTNPFERCNLWLLQTALAMGPDKLRFVCLWNGEGGDGPGGAAHMMREAENRTGQVSWVNTKELG